VLSTFVDKCHNNLFSSKIALAYLVSRSITVDDMKKYKIGFIGNLISNVNGSDSEALRFNKEWLGKQGHYVRYRIVIPIFDELGNVKGLETRALDKSAVEILKPEYKKSLQTEIAALPDSSVRYKKFYYEKSKFSACFFGLPTILKDIWETKTVFLTEGVFDCLSALRCYPNCLSTLTANINEYQLNWLRRYVKKIILLYDSDKRGNKAVENILKYQSNDFLIYSIGLKGLDVNELEIKCGLRELKSIIDYKLSTIY